VTFFFPFEVGSFCKKVTVSVCFKNFTPHQGAQAI
jgi:hypothetical protein